LQNDIGNEHSPVMIGAAITSNVLRQRPTQRAHARAKSA
jgi:hypothetical protein